MNERIRELIDQSTIWQGMVDGYIFDKEKFAELLIKDITAGQRELAKIMSDTGSGNEAYILRITASNIERKFGVEE
jgi:hypothetical protein